MPRAPHPPVAPRKQPRQERSAQLVEDILEAAIRVLVREGAERFTTVRVAEEAGVSVGSLYQYFPNKEALLFRLQTDEWQETWSVLEGILADARLAPLERVRRVVLAFFRSERQEASFRVALDDAGVRFRDAPEGRAHSAEVRRRIGVFFEEALPDATPEERAFTADFVMTSMSAVAETITEENRSLAEIDAWAKASAEMYCGYLERTLGHPSASGPDLSTLQRWLVDVPHVDDGGPTFMRDLTEHLVSMGLPLWRVSYALMTMHPEVLWRTVQWHEEQGVTVLDREHARLASEFYRKSPIAVAREGTAPVRVRLGAGELPFKTCDDLRAQGGTDYYAHGLPFSNGQTSYVSYATRAPEGFSGEALALLEGIRPFLARRLELESSYYGTRALLDVYLGKNAARRVLGGAFQRGKGELISAVIWFSDMRDFTALSDACAPAQVVETLDAYFDAVASAVAAGGGEVLKFIGDAVLAIFPVGDDPRAACRRALAAAEAAFASLGCLNEERTARAESALAIGVALHLGQVMYGNIGARDRLDFTVISSSVNEASRLEALCKSLGTPLALSEAFVKTAEAAEVVDLGAHELKGVKAPLRVFTLSRLHVRRPAG